ncbi:mCG147382 [Mus musculus]|nr:mCG147382 [Mus musculus]
MCPGTRREATACYLFTAFSVCEGVGWCLPVTRWSESTRASVPVKWVAIPARAPRW